MQVYSLKSWGVLRVTNVYFFLHVDFFLVVSESRKALLLKEKNTTQIHGITTKKTLKKEAYVSMRQRPSSYVFVEPLVLTLRNFIRLLHPISLLCEP